MHTKSKNMHLKYYRSAQNLKSMTTKKIIWKLVIYFKYTLLYIGEMLNKIGFQNI